MNTLGKALATCEGCTRRYTLHFGRDGAPAGQSKVVAVTVPDAGTDSH
jgi:hypothetical protein